MNSAEQKFIEFLERTPEGLTRDRIPMAFEPMMESLIKRGLIYFTQEANGPKHYCARLNWRDEVAANPDF